MTIDPVLVICPHCGLKSSHYVIMSGTVFRSEVYTDGRRDVTSGMHGTNPYLVRCRNCRDFYLYHENTHPVDRSVPEEEEEGLQFEEHHLTAADYAEFIENAQPDDPEEELNIRLIYWRAYNDIIRWNQEKSRLAEHDRLKDNMRANLTRLLEMLEQDLQEDYLYAAVEICRNLGRFGLAKEYLSRIPRGRNIAFLDLEKKLISAGETAVRKIPSND